MHKYKIGDEILSTYNGVLSAGVVAAISTASTSAYKIRFHRHKYRYTLNQGGFHLRYVYDMWPAPAKILIEQAWKGLIDAEI